MKLQTDDLNIKKININNKKLRNLIHYARSKCYESNIRHGKHCAIIFSNSNFEILSMHVNKKIDNASIHAEAGAITNFDHNIINFGLKNVDINDVTILVIRSDMMGYIKMSMPCVECFEEIKRNGIRRVIYSVSDTEYETIMIS